MILWFCDSDSAYKCLMVFLVQRRTRLTTVKTGLRTRPNFAYKLWRFSFDCTFSLVDSHRHQKVQKQCCHLDCIHISGFSSTGAVCKTRGMLTTIIFLVQRKPFFFFFCTRRKECFRPYSLLTQDTWPKLLLSAIQFCMVYLKSHTKVLVISVRTLTWRHF